MSNIEIPLKSGKAILLETKGKAFDKNIVVRNESYDAFWDALQDNGNRANYNYAFAGIGWTDETFNPKYPISVTDLGGNAFAQSEITTTKVPISYDVTNVSNTNVFSYCGKLKTIPSLRVTENVTVYARWFYNCYALETVNFTEDSVIAADIAFDRSPLLTSASVDSIIHALKDLTGQTAQTLTFHATVGGKLTDEQKAAISAKNWTLVY